MVKLGKRKKANTVILVRLEGTWGADAPNRVTSWRANVRKPQNATLKLQISE